MKQLFLLYLLACLPFWANSQSPQILGDLHPPTLYPFEYLGGSFHKIQDKVLFYGLTFNQGYGFWTYDGGDQATKISDYGGSDAKPAETSDGFYYINSYDVGKYWLFKHCGAPGVTLYLDDVKSFNQNSTPSIASINGKVLYPNWRESSGYELWAATDAPGSVFLVKDGNPGSGSTFPQELTKADDLIFYRGGSAGRQLWRTDGTEAGTFLLTEIIGTNQIIQPGSLKTQGNKVWFLVRKNTGETELWISDGTVAGTAMATEVPTSINFQDRFEAFFLGEKYIYLSLDAETAGGEWIATDGTAAGTELLLNLTANENYYLVSQQNTSKSILNGHFFFIYINKVSNDYELWKSDGTANGTQKVGTLEGSAIAAASTKQQFFFLQQKQGNIELWTSDGSAAGTQLVKDLGFLDSNLYWIRCESTDSTLFFRNPFLGPGVPDFPYRSDGTAPGTFPVPGAPATHLAGSNPTGFLAAPDKDVFFRADTDAFRGIWHCEPTQPFGITRLDTSSFFSYLEIMTPMSVGDKVIWFSDEQTLKVIDPGGSVSQIPLPLNYSGDWEKGPDGEIYFFADNNKSLWRTNGTLIGTFEVYVAPPNSIFSSLKSVGDSLYFIQGISLPNQPDDFLWSSDGSPAGTQPVGIIQSGSSVFLRSVQDRLAYTTYSISPYARILYVRGFPPVLFPDLYSDDFIGLELTEDQLFVMGPRVYSPVDSFHYSLWTAESGQPNLLHKFKSITGYNYNDPRPQSTLHRLGNTVLFGAGNTVDNTELWISDGTLSGTHELLDLNPSGSSNPGNFIRYNDSFWLFTAFDGTEVSWWATNGNAAGTFKIAALATQLDCFVPSVSNAYLTENRLFFAMNDGLIGQEPWVMVLEDSLKVSTLSPLFEEQDLVLWPNPAKEWIHLKIEKHAGEPVWIKIADEAGLMVYQQKHNLPDSGSLSLRLPLLPGGIYFLQLKTANGKIRAKKWMKSE